MSERIEVEYTGPAGMASMVVQDLQAGGARVVWRPPDEERGVGAVASTVVLMVVYDLGKAGVVAAVRKTLK